MRIARLFIGLASILALSACVAPYPYYGYGGYGPAYGPYGPYYGPGYVAEPSIAVGIGGWGRGHWRRW